MEGSSGVGKGEEHYVEEWCYMAQMKTLRIRSLGGTSVMAILCRMLQGGKRGVKDDNYTLFAFVISPFFSISKSFVNHVCVLGARKVRCHAMKML